MATATAEETLASAATQTTYNYHPDAYDEDVVEFGDEDAMEDGRITKFRPKDGETLRVNLLTDFVPMKKAWTHFVPDKGSYRCVSVRDKNGRVLEEGICCKKASLIADEKKRKEASAKLVFAALAAKYTNVNPVNGGYSKQADGSIPPVLLKVGWLKLAIGAFKEISSMINPEENEKVTDFDLVITNNTTTGIGYVYKRLMSKTGSRLRGDEAGMALLAQEIKPFLDGKELTGRLGKKVTPIEMAALWAGKDAAPAGGSAADISVEDIG